MRHVIVAGDRRLEDYDLVCSWLDRLLAGHLPDVMILSGAALGADRLGERYAGERGLDCRRYPADWALLGRRAGPARNESMCQDADAAIVFDGGGPGSADLVRRANRRGLAVRVVPVGHLLGGVS